MRSAARVASARVPMWRSSTSRRRWPTGCRSSFPRDRPAAVRWRAASGPTAPPGPVSLASATIEQLDELPGVGPVTAQKIVDWRQAHGPFASVDDLDQVPGIGPARIEQLRDLVTP